MKKLLAVLLVLAMAMSFGGGVAAMAAGDEVFDVVDAAEPAVEDVIEPAEEEDPVEDVTDEDLPLDGATWTDKADNPDTGAPVIVTQPGPVPYVIEGEYTADDIGPIFVEAYLPAGSTAIGFTCQWYLNDVALGEAVTVTAAPGETVRIDFPHVDELLGKKAGV